MLKKIHVRNARVGMFVQKLCGKWISVPYWRKSFAITDSNKLNQLQTCGVQEVWIDTDKGRDVEEDFLPVLGLKEIAQIIEQDFHNINKSKPSTKARVPMQDEIVRARRIQEECKEVVTAMFKEARLGKAINAADAAPLVDEICLSISRNPEAFLNIVRFKETGDYTYMHSVAVCALMIALGRQLGLSGDELKDAGMAGLLHDMGKMLVPEEVLTKPGKLTDEEFEIIKAHPSKGWLVLKLSTGVPDMALDVVLHHHERTDGMGYPEKLSGDELTLFARMAAVCDVYDALTSNRCYKNAWQPAEALRKMASWKWHFDESVFHAFVKAIGIYPTGTLVKLQSARLAVVVGQTEGSLLNPLVKAFFSIKSNEHIVPEIINLAKASDSIVQVEVAEKWGLDLKHLALV